MGKNLYITAYSCNSGKPAVALGVMAQLKKNSGKVAVFKPVINQSKAHGAQDPELNMLIKHFGLGVTYDQAHVYTLGEVRELVNSGKKDLVMETVMARYKELAATHDFVLCSGTDYTSMDPAFELELNKTLAVNLAAPVLLVVNAAQKCPAELAESVKLNIQSLMHSHLHVLSCVVSRCGSLDAGQEKALLEAARNCCPQKLLSAYIVPECDGTPSAEGKCCSKELFGAVDPAQTQAVSAALSHFDKFVKGAAIAKQAQDFHCGTVTPKMFEAQLLELAMSEKMRVVLPEGKDLRILKAADIILRRGMVAELAVLGDVEQIKKDAKANGLDLSKATLIDPAKSSDFEDFAQTYCELRKAKGITLEQARETMADATYYGTMMVYKDKMDGMVSGALNTTAHTIRPAFEFIKTKVKGASVSSIFFMCLPDRVLVMGDCAVMPNPTPQELAGSAINAAHTAKAFGIEPRVAMLSYSTGSSGKGPDVDVVIEATKLAKEMDPKLALEGPLQFDSAIDPDVAKTKLPGNPVAGKATVFIFPDLNTGNNTYKAIQRTSGAPAVGPVLLGLNKAVNDLSRGCTVEDIVFTVAITAIQAQAARKG